MTTSVTVNETSNSVTVNETTNDVTVSQGSTQTVEVNVTGPQGERGLQGIEGVAVGIPVLGDPGNIIIKSSYTNYETEWSATLDGGTFN